MNDSMLMCRRNPIDDLAYDFKNSTNFERIHRHPFAQCRPFDELHCQKCQISAFAKIKNSTYVVMRNFSSNLHFVTKSIQNLGIAHSIR